MNERMNIMVRCGGRSVTSHLLFQGMFSVSVTALLGIRRSPFVRTRAWCTAWGQAHRMGNHTRDATRLCPRVIRTGVAPMHGMARGGGQGTDTTDTNTSACVHLSQTLGPVYSTPMRTRLVASPISCSTQATHMLPPAAGGMPPCMRACMPQGLAPQ